MPRWYWFLLQVYWDINGSFSIANGVQGCIYSLSTLLSLHCYTWKMEKLLTRGTQMVRVAFWIGKGDKKKNEEQAVSTPLSFQRTNVKLLCLYSTTAIDNIKRLVIRKQKSSFWGSFSKKFLNSPYAPNSILEPSHTSSLAFGHLAQMSAYFLVHWGTPSVFAEAVLQTMVSCYALDFDHFCHKHLLMKLHKDIDMTSLDLWSPCPFFSL